jgi:acetolactate synthase I/III small subunit
MSTHTISLLVENHSGALSRVAGLFSSRGYNITSLTVAETEDTTVSRMTIKVAGDEEVLEQVVKQLNKLIDVIKVIDFRDEPFVNRELLLIRLDAGKSNRHEIISLVDVYGAKIAAVSATSITVELSGESGAVDDFIALVRPYGIKEMARSGAIAITRPSK